ncbi:hypothetical protein ACFYP6_36335 [Streptomyces goshikiensis]|uniref:COG4705 family protein n=1 Tax=Streptomyces goshikiensis TaxID=1942 RepID=UPI00369110CB
MAGLLLVAALVAQARPRRYVPALYWSAVVMVSVFGTMTADIAHVALGVPYTVSATAFALALARDFLIWRRTEGALAVETVADGRREVFHWTVVMATFALGTATGDWTLGLTGWTAGVAVLLPLGLIVTIIAGWRLGANAVLSFWLAYILTRPLGANLGDWLGSPSSDGGLGLGTALTSVIFLVAILATVAYLTRSRSDVIEAQEPTGTPRVLNPARERRMLAYYAVVVGAGAALLIWANHQPHAAATGEEDTPAPVTSHISPQEATSPFPPAQVARFRTITADTLAKVNAGDQQAATRRVTDLETAWDDDQSTLEPKSEKAWSFLDGEIDQVLKAVRAPHPDKATELGALNRLLTSLG